MIIRSRRTLPCEIDVAWDALHNPDVFRYSSWPLTVFSAGKAGLPRRFEPGQEYEVSVWAGGIVPMGRQLIRLVDDVASDNEKTLTDLGHGLDGILALLRDWKHEMALRARTDGRSDFRDTLSFQAGVMTPLLWPAMTLLWWWRGYRLSRKLGQLAKGPHSGEG